VTEACTVPIAEPTSGFSLIDEDKFDAVITGTTTSGVLTI